MSDQQLIEQSVPQGVAVRTVSPVSGGDIHRNYRVEMSDGQRYFAKVNAAKQSGVLRGEFHSLQRIHALTTAAYPKPVCFKEYECGAVLIMAFHQLMALDTDASVQLGRLLAHQHQVSSNRFGWDQDNHIGLTPQANEQQPSWLDFYREQRLRPQLTLAARNGLTTGLQQEARWLMDHLEEFIDDAAVQPALVHGDLWGGNVALDAESQQPLLFDPAPYFGDRETDLAMTRLFGGFAEPFYGAYQEVWPPAAGYQARIGLYNLYHALNHYNLFGAGYINLVADCIARTTRC